LPYYDYQCKDETCRAVMPMQLRKYEERVITCNECGGESHRLYNFRFNAHGLPNGFNTMPRDYKDVPSGTPKKRR
jgi:hypothetical protein